MAQPDHRRGRETIVAGRNDAPRTIVLLHGYTGSSADFGDIPDQIAGRLDARVIVPLLPGHGMRVEDLLPLSFDTFLQAARECVEVVVRSGRPFALGGHSFGAYLALLIAAEHAPTALFTTVIPYRLRFPFSSLMGRMIAHAKPLWKKHLPDDEWEARSGAFFYTQMPGKALDLVIDGNQRIDNVLSKITCPVLGIHARHDDLAFPESSATILGKTQSVLGEDFIVENGPHSVFFSETEREAVASKIIDFFSQAFDVPTP